MTKVLHATTTNSKQQVACSVVFVRWDAETVVVVPTSVFYKKTSALSDWGAPKVWVPGACAILL